MSIRQDAEICSRFKPQIIRLAWMVLRRIEILLGVGRGIEQGPVDIRGQRVAFEVRAPNEAPVLLPVQL